MQQMKKNNSNNLFINTSKMKKQILIVGIMLISAITFGQKKEIKNAEKELKSGNFTEAISALKQADGLIANANNSVKAQYYLAKGEAYLGDAGNDLSKLKIAAESLLKAKEVDSDGKYVVKVDLAMINLRSALVNSAIEDQNSKKYSSAAEKLYASYSISKTDTSDLYFAAGNAVNAKDYDTALKYYQMLVDINYTGIKKEYFATNKETNVEKSFDTKDGMNKGVKSGIYIKPRTTNSDSKRGNILRNMTLIYVSNNESEKAAKLIKQARIENPDDLALMNAEASLYYKAGDMVKYKAIINEVISKDPKNPELYYNLGVASKKNGEFEAAEEYYKQALELNPNYPEALINLADLMLSKDDAMIEEMNALGTSTADYNRYDEIQEDRNNLYKEALPYLEKASGIRKESIDLIRTLKNIYSQLGMDNKAKEMRVRLEELEGGE